MTSHNLTIIDIGDTVLCDLCNADYTDSEAEGGILMGTYSICPRRAWRSWGLGRIRQLLDLHVRVPVLQHGTQCMVQGFPPRLEQ
jgi:hypothetical protein